MKKHFKLHEAGGKRPQQQQQQTKERWQEKNTTERKKCANGCPLRRRRRRRGKGGRREVRATNPGATQADEPPKQPNWCLGWLRKVSHGSPLGLPPSALPAAPTSPLKWCAPTMWLVFNAEISLFIIRKQCMYVCRCVCVYVCAWQVDV